ncbi:cardiomyopathy-associated protein 5 [Hypomesus transpacificus]|uniref:cardiomyopathy-associated protein 5 n=1 Tax=Hypomesus transpacificus TaxID=137520 RepID=UPI001F075687|nr:cardiomyopathy-associated protein 5 [Hypomesus transpacificus]
MDTSLSEECVRIDADPQVTMLQGEAISEEEGTEISDEVEDLSNSLREAVHDSTIRPKLQCLMMDPSFSMVTVQGEDSGIQWETTPSRASTPWVSDGRASSLEFCSSPTERSATPGSGVAGRIIFIMDEAKIIRRKRTRERDAGRRSRAGRETPVVDAEDSEGVAARPELVGVSLPNVKGEGEAEEEGAVDPREEKEQRLFRLVSEGSEILNIVVPPKLASVDEEESKAMEDNLSFLEETPVAKPTDIDGDEVFDPCIDVTVPGQAPTEPGGVHSLGVPGGSQVARPDGTDPPGAPVARPPRTGADIDTDYFETFTLMDAEAAPGAPAAVTLEGQEETEKGSGGENQAGKEQDQPRDTSDTQDQSGAVAIFGEEIASDHLDEVFYGGTDDVGSFLEGEEDGNRDKSAFSKSPLKKSGSSLFGSQEDVLTPIFLSPGPPKIIDPALLDEPKAMAFLYTDLYEEAVGSREKEEDAESVASERSFHSRQSDREARGYLEKFVLKDETPVEDMEPDEERRIKEERLQKWSENAHKLLSQPHEGETQEDMPEAEEEITDFFRTSASSSPSDAEPFPPLLPEENATELTKEEVKAEEKSLTKAPEEPQPQVRASGETLVEEGKTQPADEPLKPSSESSPQGVGKTSVPEEPEIPAISQKCIAPGQKGKDLPKKEVPQKQQPPSQIDGGITNQKPLTLEAPPRRKTTAPKATLDLTPLSPVETAEEGEGVEGKEQREEEKEKASPAETADEGEGDGDETEKVDVSSSPPAPSQDALLPIADNDATDQGQVTRTSETEPVKDKESNQETENQDTAETVSSSPEEEKVEVAEAEERKEENCDGEPAEGDTRLETAEIESAESAETEVDPEKGGAGVTESAETDSGNQSVASKAEPDRQHGRCIIL